VLHVCTGNICRSPISEHLMRAGLGARLGPLADRVVVESAGIRGLHARPMEAGAAIALEAYGIEGSGFRARELTAQLVADADLVPGASREHRAAAVVLHPRAFGRSFTLREFARLCALVPADELPEGDLRTRARALVRAAGALRGHSIRTDPADDDVADPYRRPQAAFAACAEAVDHALQIPLDLLGGPPVPALTLGPAVPDQARTAEPSGARRFLRRCRTASRGSQGRSP
jgi:protein-tyrosine phosphatase